MSDASLETLLAQHGGDKCPYNCPVCLVLGLLRNMKPEVVAHLANAAREFYLAAKAFLEDAAPEEESRSGL